MMEWTGARFADQPTVEASTWIDGPPDAVWRVVSDIQVMPELSTELQSVRWCDGVTEPAVSHRFIGHNRHEAMGEWTTTSHVVRCDPPTVFEWAVEDPAEPSASWRFTVEPHEGGTTLRQWMRMGPARSGISFAIDRMPDREQKIIFVRLRELEKAMINTLAAIKQRVEATTT
jgi:Polyketide cyclase / dehydrase and lipid transport